MKSRSLALVALFMVQLLYALNYTFAKFVMNEGYVKPMGLVFARVLGAVILFWLLGLFYKSEKVDRKDYLKFFYAAVCGVGINMVFFLKGLEYTSPVHASVIMTSSPIIILLMSSFFLKEKITRLKIVGVILGCIGAIVLTVYGKSERAADNILLGNLFIFLNAVFYSIYIILIKKLTVKYHPFTFMKWLFLFGILLVTPLGITEFNEVDWQNFTPYVSFSVIFIVVGATFGTYVLNPLALSRLKASTVGTFIYIQPVLAGIFAMLMGVDSIGIVKISATLLIFAGVYLVSYNQQPKPIT